MSQGYFHRLNELSGSRFWVNNPTPAQAQLAVDAGAIACTTNPTYGWKQLRNSETADEVLGFVDAAITETNDDQEAAED